MVAILNPPRPITINIRPTGTNNDSTYINRKLEQAPENAILDFGEYSFQLQETVEWTNKALHLRGNGAKFIENSVIDGPMIQTNGDGSIIEQFIFEGLENLVSFEAHADSVASLRNAVRIYDTTDSVIKNLAVSGKSIGIKVDNSTNVKIYDIKFDGFSTSSMASRQYHTAVNLDGSNRCKVDRINAFICGSIVLGTLEIERCSITKCLGIDCFDNGIYISSGSLCQVNNNIVDNTVQESNSTGIKVRGNRHIVTNNHASKYGNGISVTGNGASPDSYGSNGYGNICANNVVNDTQFDGIIAGAQDGLFQRDLNICNNSIINSAIGGGGFGAIRSGGTDITIENNIIDNCDGTTGAIVLSNGSGHKINNNRLRDCAGDGIRLTTQDSCSINNNVSIDVVGQIADLRTITNSTISNNRRISGGSSVMIVLDAASTDNIVTYNRGGTVTDNGTSNTVV